MLPAGSEASNSSSCSPTSVVSLTAWWLTRDYVSILHFWGTNLLRASAAVGQNVPGTTSSSRIAIDTSAFCGRIRASFTCREADRAGLRGHSYFAAEKPGHKHEDVDLNHALIDLVRKRKQRGAQLITAEDWINEKEKSRAICAGLPVPVLTKYVAPRSYVSEKKRNDFDPSLPTLFGTTPPVFCSRKGLDLSPWTTCWEEVGYAFQI